jgi:hypothetical protein
MDKAQVGLVERHKRFLRGIEDYSLATIDESGFTRCVPVGYTYYRGAIYIATYPKPKKVRNVARESEVLRSGPHRGKRPWKGADDSEDGHPVVWGCHTGD